MPPVIIAVAAVAAEAGVAGALAGAVAAGTLGAFGAALIAGAAGLLVSSVGEPVLVPCSAHQAPDLAEMTPEWEVEEWPR